MAKGTLMFRDPPNLATIRARLAGHAVDLAAIRLRLLLRKAGFDPNQPRVPAGRPGGGQWTDGSGDGGSSGPDPSADAPPSQVVRDTSGREVWDHFVNVYALDGALAAQTVFNRDGSTIESLFNVDGATVAWDERHTVVITDSDRITFENAGPIQSIFAGDGSDGEGRLVGTAVWTDDGPQPLLHPAYVGPAAPIVEAALALFAWLNAGPRGGGTAVLAFNAREYRPSETSDEPPIFVGTLTREQTRNACPNFPIVQEATSRIADTVRREGNYWTPQGYGTEVHTQLASEINGGPRRQEHPSDPNFRAEYSLIKSEEESYGMPGAIRVDVLEHVADRGNVCVYDIKTGLSILSRSRMDEIAFNVQRRYPGTQRVIVMEVRP